MDTALSEQDLALVHALQIAPRVSWAEAAGILGSTATTLAARWDRLREHGLAWVTAHPSGFSSDIVTALVEVDCEPGSHRVVIERLRADPRAATIEQIAGGRDLLVTVLAPDLPALSTFVLDDLVAVSGVQRQRTHLATKVHFQGSAWRLDALEPAQAAALEQLGRRTRQPSTGLPPRGCWPLVEALARDGRASAAELARVTGRKPATVRRQLQRLLDSGVLSFRCEVAQEQTRWPISCSWLGRVPPAEIERTIAAIVTLPELRLCMTTTGATNLMFTVWATSREDLLRLERLISQKLPWVELVESAVSLRGAKRMGWFIDGSGRATGEVVALSALRPAP